MEIELIIRLVLSVLTIIFGALSAYFSQNEKLRNMAVKYITEAEDMYKDTTKAGGQKFNWVVETLYNLVPVPLKFIITKPLIETIVQSTFDSIERYAKMQLDKSIDKNAENK
ncbi:MAG: hypothetical protein PHE29_04795 [Tissierellia bacterium]|nr:hypothetical protein [Tissierellia bacterium]